MNQQNNEKMNQQKDRSHQIYGKSPRICRDFLRGQCRRGYCRFPHVQSPDQIVFCHDFQNSSCPRINCKFLHYSLKEEEHYRQFGEFAVVTGRPDEPQQTEVPPNVPPHSNQPHFVQMQCRGDRDCHYVSPVHSVSPPIGISNQQPMNYHHYHVSNNSGATNSVYDYRPREEFLNRKRSSPGLLCYNVAPPFKRYRDEPQEQSPPDLLAIMRRFEEEHSMLRRRIESNEIKIAELQASNEFLMAQFTQTRVTTVQQVCSQVVNPVTVTNTTSQSGQVLSAVSMAPVQVQATPIVSIAPPQTQLITNNGAPMTIATNTSQGQQLALAQQTLSTSQALAAAHPTQILGTSQITLTPALATGTVAHACVFKAPSMGLTINTSQALAMSNASQPIISYPVMTHSILPH